MKICLDAGHGGADNGASANAIKEDAWALQFVERLGHYLRALGAETIFTRSDDRKVALTTRGAIAVNAKCDLFISIHCNAAGNSMADGAEAFIAPVGPYRGNSEAIAKRLVAACKRAGLDSRGVKLDNESQHRSLTVLRTTAPKMPAILLEIGFITNGGNAALMKNARWREDLAEALAKVLV